MKQKVRSYVNETISTYTVSSDMEICWYKLSNSGGKGEIWLV